MKRYKIVSDWHTHTRYSDGRGTVEDNVRVAAEKGLTEVAITDHGPRGIFIGVESPGTYREIKKDIDALQGQYPVRVLLGAEANVIDLDGSIDIPPEIIKEMDILLVGLHPQVMAESLEENLGWMLPNFLGRISHSLRRRMRNDNTKTLVEAMCKNPVNVVTHPDLMMPVDLDEVAKASVATGCAMEINTGHAYNKDEVVNAALRRGAPLVVNSDAHYPDTVGEVDKGIELLLKWEVPPEQVINAVPVPERQEVAGGRRRNTKNSFIFKGSFVH